MPALPALSSDRSKARNLPPPSPSLSRKSSWKLRANSLAAGFQSREASEAGDADSITLGGGSVAQSKVAGVGAGAGGGGGGGFVGAGAGGAGGGVGEEDGNGSQYATDRYDLVNKPRAYGVVAGEVVTRGPTMPKKRLVPLLRELCIRIGDCTVCNGVFFGAMLAILRSAKEGDWDGKAVRLVHFFVRGMVTVQGDTEGRVLGSHWGGRGITSGQIIEAIECFREETEHRSAVRKIPAFHTLATLCQQAFMSGTGGQPSPVEVLRETTRASLASLQAQERPEMGGNSRGRALRQRQEAFEESLLVSAAACSAIRRCPALARDQRILPVVMLGCCSENPLAARHAFAVLAEQAAQSPGVVSQTLLSNAMLVPTTVGMLQTPGGLRPSGQEPNLADSLACVYYLRAIKSLAFAEALDDTMRLDMYRTMVSSVSDARHRVALEAMQCLLDHPRAWELLVNAQRQSRDADIFRRVVDRIKVCVEEATAPPTATAAAAPASGGSSSRPGSPPLHPTDPPTISHKKKKGRGSADSGPSKTGAREAQCNWALAHAACRVCRVVGRTFQVAISYQTLQNQNRAESGGDGGGGGGGGSTTGNRTGLMTGASGDGRHRGGDASADPPSATSAGYGPTDALADSGVSPSTSDTGAPCNLLGLPPSPAPRSGAIDASPWDANGGGGGGGGGEGEGGELLGGVGDEVAGQVVEEQNTAAIRDLCRALQQHRLLESPHLHVRSLALEAMFLLLPDPSPLDPQLRALWEWLQQRVEQCPSTLPDSVLSDLVDTLLTRVQCSVTSREEVIPIALALTESFMYQVPSEEMGRCVLRAWCQCIGYGGRARESVLQSVYRVLDRNIALPPERPRTTFVSAGNAHVNGGRDRGSCHARGMPSDDWTRQPGFGGPAIGSDDGNQAGKVSPTYASGGGSTPSGGAFAASLNSVPMILGGEEAFRWGGKAGGADAWSQREPQRLAYLRAKSAATRVKRSAYWFLGEFCCQLTAVKAVADSTQKSPGKSLPSETNPNSSNDLLLDVWTSPTPNRSEGGAAAGPAAGLNGMERRVAAHPVVGAMNGATLSILMRLKHAAMFEDFQTRYTCASALCRIALRLPDPIRFDAYCFLKGLADAAALFPLGAPREVPPEAGSGCGRGGERSLEGYRREQEMFSERIENAGAFGIGEVVTPVLDYLGCLYSSGDDSKAPGGSLKQSSEQWLAGEIGSNGERSTNEAEFLTLYRRVLDCY